MFEFSGQKECQLAKTVGLANIAAMQHLASYGLKLETCTLLIDTLLILPPLTHEDKYWARV